MNKLGVRIWRCLCVGLIAMFSLLAVVGCKTKYVSVPEYHTEYIVRTDTFAKSDSVYIKDSVFVYHNGDTVFVNKIAYRDRYRNVYKVKVDTIFKSDSISVPYPTERQLTKNEQRLISLGRSFLVIMIVVGVYLCIWWYRNKRC